MNELTKTQVLEALERPVARAGERWKCRICPRTFPHKNSVAVHEITHRRAVGLAPPPHRGNKVASKTVVCRYEGCQDVLNRSSLPAHLRGQKHRLSAAAASFWGRQRRDEDIQTTAIVPVAVLKDTSGAPPSEAVEPSPLTDLAAVEAVTGILAAARSDGLFPTRMLPMVHDLIGHTDEVLVELRRLTDG